MKFSLCFCLKRNRGTYSISTTNVSYTNSNSTPTTTIAPLPLSSNIPVVSNGSDYEKIIGSSNDGEIGIINDYRTSTTSMEHDGYAKVTPIRSQQQSFDDNTGLYATVDKTRTANKGIRIKTNTTSTNDANLRQGSSPVSTTASSPQPLFSPSSYRSEFSIASERSPPPLQVYTNTTMNTITDDHDDNSSSHPHYDEVIIRESLQYRAQRLHIEEEQTPQEQQLRENYYSSLNSERGTTTNSDLYAEIANSSASGTVYQNPRSSNGSGINDNLSERYATVIETNNIEEQSTTNCANQEVNSLIF